MPVCFLRGDRKAVDLDGRGVRRDLGGVGEGKLISEYSVYEKKSIFNIRK